jgi:hypothetical protein
MANGYVGPYLSKRASTDFRENSWSLLVSIIFIVVFCAVAWFASPKGENQTYVFLLVLPLDRARHRKTPRAIRLRSALEFKIKTATY